MELKNTKISIGQTTNSENAEAIAAQADKIGIGLYSLDRYPIVGNEQNGFAFGLGMISLLPAKS